MQSPSQKKPRDLAHEITHSLLHFAADGKIITREFEPEASETPPHGKQNRTRIRARRLCHRLPVSQLMFRLLTSVFRTMQGT